MRSRAFQTALVHFRSGPLRGMTFVLGMKSFFACPCSFPASPAQLMNCCAISLGQLFGDQDLVCDMFIKKEQMDLM
ncbi:uncharacterized protein TNCV_284161 [Trichonephila clavipes]|uniref:Uncharacterized protein n=1 Tax=Trichonephila clavipes TaxID=2585209 RepID=A0A8X6SIZ7_TRICX|nr:uncharacterized protein TNCV_284161 [Trichonephila clavipes]